MSDKDFIDQLIGAPLRISPKYAQTLKEAKEFVSQFIKIEDGFECLKVYLCTNPACRNWKNELLSSEICPKCKREGHKVNAVLVADNSAPHYLDYCICCGEKLLPKKKSRAYAKIKKPKTKRRKTRA